MREAHTLHVSFGFNCVSGMAGIRYLKQRNTIVRALSNNSKAKARLVLQEKMLTAKQLKLCVTDVVLMKIVRVQCADYLKLVPVQSGGKGNGRSYKQRAST